MVLGALSLISNNFVALQILEPTTWNKCTKETFLDTVLGPRRVVQKDNAGDVEYILRFLSFIKWKIFLIKEIAISFKKPPVCWTHCKKTRNCVYSGGNIESPSIFC